MERLTVKWKDKVYDTFDPVDVVDNEYSKANYNKILTKLGEYEDLEEQGRLVKLPCKVGDTVYEIHYTNRQYVILSHVVSKFVIIPYRFPRVEIYFENENGFSTSDLLGQLNEDLFLTRVEAEAKLKELRGRENESSN